MNFMPGWFPGAAGSAAGGAFPEILDSATTTPGATERSTYDVNLPGAIESGDLLVMFLSAGWTSNRTVSTPTGWTSRYNEVGSGGNLRRSVCFTRVADGSEGSTVSVSFSGNVFIAAVVLRIASHSEIYTTTPTNGNSTSPNPPSLDPGVGAQKFLWLATAHVDFNSSSDTYSSDPSNYGDAVQAINLYFGKNKEAIRVVSGQLEVSSEDPGSFSLTASCRWVAGTVAIKGT